MKKLLNFYFKDTISISFFQEFLDVANLSTKLFDGIIQAIFCRLNDHVVRMQVLKLFNAKAALELADAVEAMLSLIKAGDAPEILAFDTAFAGVEHSLNMK